MLYLSVPYTHENHDTELLRYMNSCELTARLYEAGVAVYNPLANAIPAIELGGCKMEHADWMKIDIEVLRLCSMMVVLELDGWENSKGVQEEIELAHKLDLPVLHQKYDANTHNRIIRWVQ